VAIKRCKAPFSANVDGVPRAVAEGELIQEGDPILKGREHLFEDVQTFMSDRSGRRVEDATADPAGGVEDASAEPGRRRATRRAKNPTSKESDSG
jgi:hypothetical protein